MGLAAWSQVIERSCEGMIGKDENSTYEGGPTRRRVKVKQKGWTDPDNRWGIAASATIIARG